MAALTAPLLFRWSDRASPLAAWDIRFRVAASGLLSASVLALGPAALPGLMLLVALALAAARSTLAEAWRVVRSFSGFLVFFFTVGLVFTPTWAQAGFLGLQALRLLLLLLLGHALALSARPADVAEGLRWYLGWLGRERAWAAASMAGWALASVPLLLDQAAGLNAAAALRGLNPRRRPGTAFRLLTLGLLVRSVERSADLAAALEARGFGLAVPASSLRARPGDAAALFAAAGACAFCAAVSAMISS